MVKSIVSSVASHTSAPPPPARADAPSGLRDAHGGLRVATSLNRRGRMRAPAREADLRPGVGERLRTLFSRKARARSGDGELLPGTSAPIRLTHELYRPGLRSQKALDALWDLSSNTTFANKAAPRKAALRETFDAEMKKLPPSARLASYVKLHAPAMQRTLGALDRMAAQGEGAPFASREAIAGRHAAGMADSLRALDDSIRASMKDVQGSTTLHPLPDKEHSAASASGLRRRISIRLGRSPAARARTMVMRQSRKAVAWSEKTGADSSFVQECNRKLEVFFARAPDTPAPLEHGKKDGNTLPVSEDFFTDCMRQETLITDSQGVAHSLLDLATAKMVETGASPNIVAAQERFSGGAPMRDIGVRQAIASVMLEACGGDAAQTLKVSRLLQQQTLAPLSARHTQSGEQSAWQDPRVPDYSQALPASGGVRGDGGLTYTMRRKDDGSVDVNIAYAKVVEQLAIASPTGMQAAELDEGRSQLEMGCALSVSPGGEGAQYVSAYGRGQLSPARGAGFTS